MIECPLGMVNLSYVSPITQYGNTLDSLVSRFLSLSLFLFFVDLDEMRSDQGKTFFIGLLTRNSDYLMMQLGCRFSTFGESVRIKNAQRICAEWKNKDASFVFSLPPSTRVRNFEQYRVFHANYLALTQTIFSKSRYEKFFA